MKKAWENATLESLEFVATAGGSIYNETQDAEAWWHEEENRWEIPVGEDEKLS